MSVTDRLRGLARNREARRAQESRARERARMPWEPLAVRLLSAEERARGNRLGLLVDVHTNNVLMVQAYQRDTAWGAVLHLVVRRNDGESIAGWDLLQRVKSEIAGDDAVAVEVYPAEADVIDQANLRHLFVLPPDFDLHLTIRGRWT